MFLQNKNPKSIVISKFNIANFHSHIFLPPYLGLCLDLFGDGIFILEHTQIVFILIHKVLISRQMQTTNCSSYGK